MTSSNDNLSSQSLAELALVISRVGPVMSHDATSPSAASLSIFWQSTRSLERRWTESLVGWSNTRPQNIALLQTIAPRIFLCEAVTRIWSTILASLFEKDSRHDMRPVARNAVYGIVRARNELLSQMLQASDEHQNAILDLDRLRRRCERWTDLLLGPIAVKCGCFEFAIDQDRARDFGEEGLLVAQMPGFDAYHHLISAGLRLKFNMQMPLVPIEEPEFLDLMHSILSSLPHQAFQRDGTLRSKLEQRIVADGYRLERLANVSFRVGKTRANDSSSASLGGSFFNRTPISE